MIAPTYTFGELTDTGVLRPNNQDSMLSEFYPPAADSQHIGLFVVSDGLGGHPDGDRASKLVVQTVSKEFGSRITDTGIMDALVGAIQAANTELRLSLPESGATITAAVVQDREAYIAHAGDSRAYVIVDDRMFQLTHDHTMVQRLIELGQITPEEADDHPMDGVLYRSLGHTDTVAPDTLIYELPAGSRLLLCSDGLWRMVAEPLMLDIILKETNPQEACDKLVTLANHRGGVDNVTAILVNVA